MPLPKSGKVLVGAEDSSIVLVHGDDIIEEWSESDQIAQLCAYSKSIFAYALVNGTVGVYQNDKRLWKMKSAAGEPVSLLL